MCLNLEVSIFRKVFQQTVWQLVGKALTTVSTIVILGLITRNYGESGTGLFTLVLTYLAFFYLFSDFSLNAYILNLLNEESRKNVFRQLLGLRLLLAFVLALVALFLLPFLPFADNNFILLVIVGSLSILGFALNVTSNAIFQKSLRYDLTVLPILVGVVINFIFLPYLIIQQVDLFWLMLVVSFGWIGNGLTALMILKGLGYRISPVFDLSFIKKTFLIVWPISLTLVLNVIYFRVDAFLLTFFHSYSVVGVYNLAYQIFQSVIVIPTFILNGLYPLMLSEFKNSRADFYRTFKKSFLIMLGLGVLTSFITWIFSDLGIRILAGESGFLESPELLRILSLGFPAFFVSSLFVWTLVTVKKYKSILVIYLIGLLVNVSLNFLFIPQYSSVAAAWVTVLSEYLILMMQATILFNESRKRL